MEAARSGDGKLYRQSHATFDEYVKDRWGRERRRACQLIDAAEITKDLCTTVHKLPATETQARPLASVPRHERAEVLQEVVDTAAKGETGEPKLTAKHVEKVAAAQNGGCPIERCRSGPAAPVACASGD